MRLDLLPWLMPLPANSKSSTGFSSAGESSDSGSSSETTVASEEKKDRDRITPGVPVTATTSAIFGSLVKSVHVSAAVQGFALATWRGRANRDGFVLGIDRLDTSPPLFFS